MVGDDRVAVIVERDPKGARYKHDPADLSGRTVRGLLDLSGAGEIRFLPLRTLPEDGQRVELSFRVDGVTTSVRLGDIARGAGSVARIRSRLAAPLIDRAGLTSLRATGAVDQVAVRIGSERVLRGRTIRTTAAGGVQIQLEPVDGRFLFARGQTERPIDIATLPENGTIDLVLLTDEGREMREELYRYQVVEKRIRRFPKRLAMDRRIGGRSESPP